MKVLINTIKPNQSNPRFIKEDKFKKLVKSIKEFPEMLELRPIVVNEEMVVLGGNMRLEACKKAGLKEVYIKIAKGLTKEQENEFIIKDNVGFGEWDWDALANEWDINLLTDWGLDIIGFDEEEIEEEEPKEQEDSKIKIVLNYTGAEHDKVINALSEIASTPEQAVWKLLNLK